MRLSNCSPLFPVWNFPPIIRDAVNELQANSQAPLPLVASSVLAAVSLACQWHVNVRRMDGREGPCSLIFITIANSGERKSSVDRQSLHEFYKYDTEQRAVFENKVKDYKAALRIWEVECGALRRKLEKMTVKGESTEEVKMKLVELATLEPSKPQLRKILYSDVTPEALIFSMYENSSSVGVVSDEAGSIFTSNLVNDLGMINKLWDGSPLTVDRRTSESFTIEKGCATISWMSQEQPFRDFLARKGDEARGSGFFARGLFSFPVSTQGTRFRESATLSWEHFPRFNARVAELLKLQELGEIAGDKPGEMVLHLSPEAQADTIEVYNHVESHTRPGGFFCEATDYASKILENTLRMAAIFHFFSGQEGDISIATFRAAEKVIGWYADEFVRLFSPVDPVSEAEQEVQLLERWFIKLYHERGWDRFPKSFIRKFGPNSLRSKDRLDWVLGHLASTNRVALFMIGKTNYVDLNMNYFKTLLYGSQSEKLPYRG